MAVELDNLYKEIYSKYDVRLQTDSCFEKKISWVHIVENVEFADLLHGDELVFNSALNDETEEIRKAYINKLIEMDAGGLIVAVQEGHEFSEDLIDYCNTMQFPLFAASWQTPYINIMRRFSEILIDNERKEMNFIAALKNTISHPQDSALYIDYFERNGFSNDSSYTIAILGYTGNEAESKVESIDRIERALHRVMKQSVLYSENDTYVILTAGYSPEYLRKAFSALCQSLPNIQLGIGSTENQISDIHRSYQNAKVAYRLRGDVISDNPLYYDELGTYQILADMKEPDIICPVFVRNTLGKLMDYDEKHKTKYMTVLNDFFENDCSITQTANATFYHQNTLKYKIKNIKEILGYDIMSNENRVKIMLSLYILRIAKYTLEHQKDG